MFLLMLEITHDNTKWLNVMGENPLRFVALLYLQLRYAIIQYSFCHMHSVSSPSSLLISVHWYIENFGETYSIFHSIILQYPSGLLIRNLLYTKSEHNTIDLP